MFAVIRTGGKQYRVAQDQLITVERLAGEAGSSVTLDQVLMLGGDGAFELAPKTQVTARVVVSPLGEKIRIGKYRPKSGYRRHTGFRAKLSQIEIESIGGAAKKGAPAKKAEPTAAKKAEPAAKRDEAPAKLVQDYADLTVADIKERSAHWTGEQVEAALEYERAHAKRKGALAALEARKEHLDGS